MALGVAPMALANTGTTGGTHWILMQILTAHNRWCWVVAPIGVGWWRQLVLGGGANRARYNRRRNVRGAVCGGFRYLKAEIATNGPVDPAPPPIVPKRVDGGHKALLCPPSR